MDKVVKGFAILIPIVGFVVTVLAWLVPFNPIGPSPLVPKPTEPSKVVPSPLTSKPTEQSKVAPSATDSYDDFNSSSRDFDKNRWKIYKVMGCDAFQSGGVAVFTTITSAPPDIRCEIYLDQLPLSRVGIVEARIYASAGATGGYSIGIIQFSTYDLAPNQKLITQCGIRQIPNEKKVELFFNFHSTNPEGQPEIYQTTSATTNRWYKMRFEMDAETAKARCFADEKLIGEYTPKNPARMGTVNFRKSIEGFWTEGSQATYYVDDVRFVSK